MAYVAGLSFNLDDIIIPEEKRGIVEKGQAEVDQIQANYEMGFITDTERYNQVIDAWTHVNNDLGNILMKEMTEADQGFNAVYMIRLRSPRFEGPNQAAFGYAWTDG